MNSKVFRIYVDGKLRLVTGHKLVAMNTFENFTREYGLDRVEIKRMELKDTVEMMGSSDYKERFRAEYFQLKIRMSGLSKMLVKYKEGTLNFTPSCSYSLLSRQLETMKLYASYLLQRAEIEDIDLYN